MTPTPTGPGSGSGPNDWDPEDFLAKLNTRIDAHEAEAAQPSRPGARIRAIGRWTAVPRWSVGIAASIAVAVGLTILVLRVSGHPGAGIPGREYATAAGQRETVTLPDGTQFTLAPGSRLRLAADYARGHRDATLVEGEAYFVVVHDARHPFAVQARNAVARDIGTRFVIRSYDEEPVVSVAVVEGAVALDQHDVHAGSVGQVDRAGATTVVPTASVDPYIAWTRGELVFDRTPLSAVAHTLTRWYGRPVIVGDSATTRTRYTGVFTTEPPEQVAALVATATATRLERRADTLAFVAP